MAYEVKDPKDEEEIGNPGASTEAPQNVGGSAGSLIQPNAMAQGQITPGQNAAGGGFTDIRKYLAANQGQGANVANTIVGKLDENSQAAKTAADQAAESVKQAANSQVKDVSDLYSTLNPDRSGSGLVSEGGSPGEVQKAASSGAGSLTDSDRERIKALQNASYNAPDVSQAFQDANQKAAAATEQGNLTKSDAGRYQLLQQYASRPQYSLGQKRLDQALLQADPSAKSVIEASRQKAEAVNPYFQSKQSEVQPLIEQAGLKLDQNKQGLQGALEGGKSSLLSQLQQRAQAQNLTADQKAEQLKKDAYGQLRNYLGQPAMPIEGGGYDTTFYGVDPSKYIQTTHTDAQSVATNPEINELNSLNGLLGLAGTASIGSNQAGASGDWTGYQNAVNDVRNQFNVNKQLDNAVMGYEGSGPKYQGASNLNGNIDALLKDAQFYGTGDGAAGTAYNDIRDFYGRGGAKSITDALNADRAKMSALGFKAPAAFSAALPNAPVSVTKNPQFASDFQNYLNQLKAAVAQNKDLENQYLNSAVNFDPSSVKGGPLRKA